MAGPLPPTPPQGPGGGSQLDGPPPSPSLPPGAPGSGMPLEAAKTPQDAKGGGDAIKTLIKMGASIDQALLALARALPPAAENFNAAREHIKIGVAKGLAMSGRAPATSPTAAGSQFPGGGFSTPKVGF